MNVSDGHQGFLRRAFTDDEALWRRFAAATHGADFLEGWLALQCSAIQGARAGLVLFEDVDSRVLAPVAFWPRRADFSHLKATAERAVTSGEAVVERDPETGRARAAHPIEVDGHLTGLALIEIAGDDDDVQRMVRELHWGIGWLQAEILRRAMAENAARLDRGAAALDVLAVAGEQPNLDAAALAVVNELAVRLACDRVALGVVPAPGRLKLAAISNTAWFKRRAGLVGGIENAMGEAIDQTSTIVHPRPDGAASVIDIAHRDYAEREGTAALLTTVLTRRGKPVGALFFERRRGAPFGRDEILTAEAATDLIGPVVELERRQRRWISGRLADGVATGMRRLFGPHHPSWKLAAIAAVAVLAALVVVEIPFTVSAKAVLEGAQQRAAAAPFQGFVASARVRAGDTVKRGDVLAELDDKDLKLERTRWESEYARLAQEKRKALAALDRTEAALVDAQIEQARAQLDLTLLKLERSRVTASIDGVVISGDWSQKLGAPVDQGTVMFEIAPPWSYRVHLEVDEGDMRHVAAGQPGRLLLAGRADATLPFEVSRLTSVAAVEDGQNVFRVEATLAEGGEAIRPGMEGIGKIEVGRRAAGWVWTRRLVDWGRLWVWRNTP